MIPFASTPCAEVLRINNGDDLSAKLAFSAALAAIVIECNATYISSGQPPMILDAFMADRMAAAMQKYFEDNPTATFRDAVTVVYNSTRKLHLPQPRFDA